MIKQLIINIILVANNFAMPPEARAEFVKEFEAAYSQQLPGNVRLKVREVHSDPCAVHTGDLSSRTAILRLRCYQAQTRARRPALYLVPPVVDKDGAWWMTGYAARKTGRCGGRVGYAVIESANHLGVPRWNHSLTAAAHELGHLLGANHVWSRSVMHPNPLPLVVASPLPFDPISIHAMMQIANRCAR